MPTSRSCGRCQSLVSPFCWAQIRLVRSRNDTRAGLEQQFRTGAAGATLSSVRLRQRRFCAGLFPRDLATEASRRLRAESQPLPMLTSLAVFAFPKNCYTSQPCTEQDHGTRFRSGIRAASCGPDTHIVENETELTSRDCEAY